MLWLNPSALFALAAIAAPILIHILIQRRAERLPFPTLRFLQPTRLAAIRRHLLEDLPLLAVRAALLGAAVAALAGPLLVTASRRQAWDQRIVRARVTNLAATQPTPSRDQRDVLRAQTFDGPSLSDGIRRAIVWLETMPPARREIVVASPLPIGSIAAADIAQVPAEVGIRFERQGTLPETRNAAAGRLLTGDGVRALEVILAADRTSVRDAATGEAVQWPIDVVVPKADQPAVDAAIAAVLSERVWAGPPDRRVRLLLASGSEVAQPPSQGYGEPRRSSHDQPASGGGGFSPAISTATAIAQVWMADAAARIARDQDVHSAAARVPTGLTDARFIAAPWQRLASAADGRPLAVAAADADRLLIASAAPASNIVTPLLLRSIANGIASTPDLQAAEVMPIPDPVLQQWSRPAARVVAPRVDTVDPDDRRWLWLTALVLLALETWMRRTRKDTAAEIGEETARVA